MGSNKRWSGACRGRDERHKHRRNLCDPGRLHPAHGIWTAIAVLERLCFMRFLGLGLADPVPDANTIWTFREALKKVKVIDALFLRFDEALRASGYLAMGGQIVDATIVAAPKQRNTADEKKAIKEGRIPQARETAPEGS